MTKDNPQLISIAYIEISIILPRTPSHVLSPLTHSFHIAYTEKKSLILPQTPCHVLSPLTNFLNISHFTCLTILY